MRNRMKLGRAKYKLYRYAEGVLQNNGMYSPDSYKELTIRANIQGGLFWNSVKFSDSGDIGKQAISIRSDEPVYIANQGRKGDVVEFLGSYWEVKDCRPYVNLRSTRHWEAMAVLIDSDKFQREVEG